MAVNKIPIKVRHLSSHQQSQVSDEIPSSSHYRLSSASNGISPRLRDSTGDLFNMTRLNDETDNIHARMREFEERCKKWREEFFSQTSSNAPTTSATLDFDQRVPPLSPRFSSSTHTAEHNSPSTTLATKPFSTLNKTYYQDTTDGGKKYVIEFDIGDFKSNEISVSIQGKSLIVKGDREIKAGSATETKNFNREISLPDHIDANTLTSYLVDKNPQGSTSSASILFVEAAVIADKYYSRRSRLSPSPPPPPSSSISANRNSRLVPTSISPTRNTTTSSQFNASKSTKSGYSSTTHTSTGAQTRLNDSTATKSFSNLGSSRYEQQQPQTKSFSSLSNINQPTSSTAAAVVVESTSNILSASVPDLMNGPTLNKDDGYTIYKFDFKGYDQSEIHLSITENKALEVKATKIIADTIGKTYKEFKREIQLGEHVDINLIKNVLVDGILTIKIPPNNETSSSIITSSTNNAPTTGASISPSRPSPSQIINSSAFREIKSQDGRLIKLQADLNGYDPENLKIILTANNVLKVSAEQINKMSSMKFNQEYTLPNYIQPENMKAIMSRDGILTIDFQANDINNNNIQSQNNSSSSPTTTTSNHQRNSLKA